MSDLLVGLDVLANDEGSDWEACTEDGSDMEADIDSQSEGGDGARVWRFSFRIEGFKKVPNSRAHQAISAIEPK